MGNLVSVIIPVYQAEATLERCIQSIVAQTHAALDIVLVDDGSTDASPAICDAWTTRDERIRIVHQRNGGLSAARNTGLDHAKGDWVTFVDSDDWIDAQAYERCLATEADIVEYVMEYDGHPISDPQPPGISDLQGQHGAYWLEHRLFLRTSVCNKLFRRRLFEGVRFPVGELYEDIALLPTLLLRASSIASCGGVCYHYTMNEKGICRTATHTGLTVYLSNMLEAAQQLGIDLGSPQADSFYLQMLDIQLSVCKAGGQEILLPERRNLRLGAALSQRQRIKALLLNLLGLKRLMRLWA